MEMEMAKPKKKEHRKLSSKLVRIKTLAEETLKGLDDIKNGCKEKTKEKILLYHRN